MNSNYPPRSGKSVKTTLTAIVDGQALLKVAYHGASTLYNSKGQHIGGLFQFFSILRKIVKENDVKKIVVFWDGKLSGKLRHNIYPDYKQNRHKSYSEGEHAIDVDLEYQKLRVKQYLEELSIKQFQDEVVEADDCIAYYIQNKEPNERILICSGDRDLAQLISNEVSIFLFDRKRSYNYDNYKEYFDHDIRNLKLIKIIGGDSSDNIKGVKGVAKGTLLELFPELNEKECNLNEIIDRAKILQSERKTKSKKLQNIIDGVTVGVQGSMLYEINEKIINLSTPLLTEECLVNLNNFIGNTIDPEGREIKNLLDMMMEDEFIKAIPGNSEGFVEYLQPFLKLIEK